MSGKAKNSSGYFRFLDFIIVVFFLSIAAFSVNLFRLDLLRTIDLLNVEPVGTVVVKKNTVQRRHSDRVLWDRLANESPVYIGDIIRVAEISAATLFVEDNSIDLDENTIIIITRSEDGRGIQIMLNGGSFSVAAGNNSNGINININGRQVQAGPGTVMSASLGTDGRMSVQVNEGGARFINTGAASREIRSGSTLDMNADGSEYLGRGAVVTQPAPNARYLKTSIEPLSVDFSWNRINLAANETLRLEISADRNFSSIKDRFENLDRRAQAQFDAGLWYWRLSFENTVLSTGRLTVADGAGLKLYSPAVNSLFQYKDEMPLINFQWEEAEEAVSYVIEINASPDFTNPQIRKYSSAAFMGEWSLGEGTWYWRVMPVFPPVFNGGTVFSNIAFFRIEQSDSKSENQNASLSQWLDEEASSFIDLPPELPPELIPQELSDAVAAATLPKISLTSPSQGAQIAGLTAMSQQTVFIWEADDKFASSRFVLSRNSDPLQGQPSRQILNPDRTVRVDQIGEGIWYWTVELRTESGLTVSAPPRRLQVLAIPLLSAPQNLRPANRTVFDHEQLISRATINFSWSAVRGANAYIFTLYQQTGSGRRQVVRETINGRTSYTLESLRVLDRGTFVWQVEAVSIGRNNVIDRRGRAAESTFVLDFNSPLPVQIEDTGILYGN